MNPEFTATLKGNWMVIFVAVVAFSFIVWFYPHSDMGKQQVDEAMNNEVKTAILLHQEGQMSLGERNKVLQKYGLTEDDIYPLRRYIEENN